MSKKPIKYRYAFDSNSEIINISNVVPKTEQIFTCISCGNILIPKFGKERIHGEASRQRHFAHKTTDELCNNETYLHSLAKNVFYKEYNKCIDNKEPFYCDFEVKRICSEVFSSGTFAKNILFSFDTGELILREFSYGASNQCENVSIKKKYDLTKKFDKKAKLETKLGDFRPDILLESSEGDVIFVEIFVTHRVSDEKKNSGKKIIEIDMSYQNNIELIESHYIEERFSPVWMYNFNIIPTKDLCESCHYYGYKYRVPSDKEESIKYSDLTNISVKDFKKSTESTNFVLKEVLNNKIKSLHNEIDILLKRHL